MGCTKRLIDSHSHLIRPQGITSKIVDNFFDRSLWLKISNQDMIGMWNLVECLLTKCSN